MPNAWKDTATLLTEAIQSLLPSHFVTMTLSGEGDARRFEVLRSPTVVLACVGLDGTTSGSGHGGAVRRWLMIVTDGEMQSPAARRERLLDSAETLRAGVSAALADAGVLLVPTRERILPTAEPVAAWEIELLEFLADPMLAPPVLGAELELLGTLAVEWDAEETSGTLDIGGTPPLVGEVLVLEPTGGAPRVSLGRVTDVDGLAIETTHAPDVVIPSGSSVHRVIDAVMMPCPPAASGPGPTSRRTAQVDVPLASAFSGRVGAADAWERRLRFSPLVLAVARDLAQQAASFADAEGFLFIDEWRRVFAAEFTSAPEWESLGDNWGALSLALQGTT
jgi:hypothetical protein